MIASILCESRSSKLLVVDVVSSLEVTLVSVQPHAALVVGLLGDSEIVPSVFHPVVWVVHRRIAFTYITSLSRLSYQHSGTRKWLYILGVQSSLASFRKDSLV